MVSFNIFKRRSSAPVYRDFAFLTTDMHSHLVPAIDDGSDSLETSLLMLEGLIELGYKKVITTPHIRPDHFPNTGKIIKEGLEKVKVAARSAKMAIEIGCAAEYFVDYSFPDKIETGELLSFSGNKVLIELSTFSPPPNLFDTIFRMGVKGYRPILAHPERYVYFSDIQKFRDFKEAGCLLQLNILSLTGHYGKKVKELASLLLNEDLVDLLGTDMHHLRHLESMKAVVKNRSLMRALSKKEFMNADL